MRPDSRYEPVIGLEVHARLSTRTKIFCGCAHAFGARPNHQTCPVCLGHPGALPVLSRAAVELALRAALALGCDVAPTSAFARKHYFYPDLPKGYQITQHDRPLARGGRVEIESAGRRRRIGLVRLHLEEDAGKLMHHSDSSLVDFNRAGTPLIEIVTEPALRSPAEAHRFLERLRSILRYVGACDGNMEQGSLRCDANVSLRPAGARRLGTRTELKNLNSFRNVERALAFEIERQSRQLRAGRPVEQQTVAWDERAGETRPLRAKEEAPDYRYFPEPDLPPVRLEAERVERYRVALPEGPAARKRRYVEAWGLSEAAAHLLTLERPVAEIFERIAAACGAPGEAANWMIHDVRRAQADAGRSWGDAPIAAEVLAELIGMVADGTVSATVARREIFPELHAAGEAAGSPRQIARARGLEQVGDPATLTALAHDVLDAHPRQVESYRAGKRGLLGFFVGKVMEASGNRADPRRVRGLLEELLADYRA